MNNNKRFRIDSAVSMLKTMEYQLEDIEYISDTAVSGRLTTLVKEVDSVIMAVKGIMADEGTSSNNVPGNLSFTWDIEHGALGELNSAIKDLRLISQSLETLASDLKQGIFHQLASVMLIGDIRVYIDAARTNLTLAKKLY